MTMRLTSFIFREKVLMKYSADPADSLKYRAAVFLIENMPGHGYYRGEQLDRFLEYYPLLKEVRSRKGSPDEAVDSIRRKYGTFDISALGYYEDIRTVDSAYLCDNIEWAFKVWREQRGASMSASMTSANISCRTGSAPRRL